MRPTQNNNAVSDILFMLCMYVWFLNEYQQKKSKMKNALRYRKIINFELDCTFMHIRFFFFAHYKCARTRHSFFLLYSMNGIYPKILVYGFVFYFSIFCLLYACTLPFRATPRFEYDVCFCVQFRIIQLFLVFIFVWLFFCFFGRFPYLSDATKH